MIPRIPSPRDYSSHPLIKGRLEIIITNLSDSEGLKKEIMLLRAAVNRGLAARWSPLARVSIYSETGEQTHFAVHVQIFTFNLWVTLFAVVEVKV